MAQMGGVVESLQIAENRTSSNHVLAGDIIAPENNDLAVQTISDFLVRNIGAQPRPEPVVEPPAPAVEEPAPVEPASESTGD